MLAALILVSCLWLAVGQRPASAQIGDPYPQVRVTTGYRMVSGWESNLVEGNPNLAHFHWSPMTHYTQGRMQIQPVDGPTVVQSQGRRAVVVPQRKPVYIRPIHIETAAQVRPNKNPYVARHVDAHLLATKPAAVATKVAGTLVPPTASEAVSGQLASPQIAVYPGLYGVLGPRHSAELGGCLYDKQVSGRVKSCRAPKSRPF